MNAATSKNKLGVGIDGRVLTRYEMRGFARHTVELFRAMQEMAGDRISLTAFSPEPIAPEFLAMLDITPVVFSARREILWEQVELPRHLQAHGIEVFHVTANRGLPYRHVCPYVLTCHDIIDRLPEYCGREPWRSRWRKGYADFASRHSADQYITVSNFSKQDICRFYGIAPGRVAVIYNAAHPRFSEVVPAEEIARVREKYRLPQAFFLFLGGFDKRKNVATLVEAFAQLPHDVPALVLAGEHKWDFPAVAERITALGLGARVVCPGTIADEDLAALYQGAFALVHPSRYEGFGLQVVEAMASGIPVLASNTTSLPEVLGGSGLLFDPEDAGSIAQAMERIARNPELRAELAAKASERAKFFSWHKAAEQTLEIYRSLAPGAR